VTSRMTRHRRVYQRACQLLVLLSMVFAGFYLKWLLVDSRPDNRVLFGLLLAAELFNVGQAAGFWYTIFRQDWTEPATRDFDLTTETVDIFITVCGEPADLVERTIMGAVGVRHPRKTVWVLDDGHSTEIEMIATMRGAKYLWRADRTGAKAGNINAALARTKGDFVVILDADHVPKPEFLERTMGAFSRSTVGFVQTPQSYGNRETNRVAAGAHEQLGIFYGPIMRGRNHRGAVFSCGTNVIFRRAAFRAVHGMPEDSITEDLRISLMLVKEGFTSVYVPEVLAEGVGPSDVSSFFSQQSRWARGGLEILFKRRPFSARMRLGARVEYALSFMYWFTGWAYAIYLVLPVAFLVFGERPVQVPNQYPVYFLPYLIVTLTTMAYALEFEITFRSIWFTLASFPTFVGAFFSAIFGRRARFVVTSKTGGGRSLRPVWMHIVVIGILVFAIAYGIVTRGFTPSVTNNVAFALGHILVLQGFVRYARRPEGAEQVSAFDTPAEASEQPARGEA